MELHSYLSSFSTNKSCLSNLHMPWGTPTSEYSVNIMSEYSPYPVHSNLLILITSMESLAIKIVKYSFPFLFLINKL